MKHVFISVFNFYIDGFRSMTVGKVLWTIILIKLSIMFFIIKPFFFSHTAGSRNVTGQGASEYVFNELVNRGR